MKRMGKSILTTSMVSVAALVLAACGGGSEAEVTSSGGTTSGEPVAGGTASILMMTEPTSLDPAKLTVGYSGSAPVGTSLYGTLFTQDLTTYELIPSIGESLTSTDGGKTFDLKLRPGVTFSDGSALNAEAVKFNWDRMKNPELGSASLGTAAQVTATKVVDDLTMQFTMGVPNPNFGQGITVSSLNWVASPAALKKGSEEFDANPIGAGPFTLKSWIRQDKMDLTKNPSYWNAPKPYLDSITIRTVLDSAQRLNNLQADSVDVVVDNKADNTQKAEAAGYGTYQVMLNGGNGFALNFRKAPFDDPRVREAFVKAIDISLINEVVYEGVAELPTSLFNADAPFYTGTQITQFNATEAQALFDEISAEQGSPVAITLTAYSLPPSNTVAQAIQAQMSAYKNVTVKVEEFDFPTAQSKSLSGDFQAMSAGTNFLDPETQMYTWFHGDSKGNTSGINDPVLNDALNTGRQATDLAERKDAYAIAQDRITSLNPYLWYVSPQGFFWTGKKFGGGIEYYGNGSLVTEGLWMQS